MKKREKGALFISAGIFIGMGLGFVYGSLPAGLFIGMCAGFVLFAISLFFEKK